MLTQERLQEILNYNPETGIFTWIAKSSPKSQIQIGQRAGYRNLRGYRVIIIDGEIDYEQILACLYMTGKWPTFEMDHKNDIKDDNRWDNLDDIPGIMAQLPQAARRVRPPKRLGFADFDCFRPNCFREGGRWP
jgi:hypothetical protein